MKNIFFTSDTHFSHKLMSNHRNFSSIEEMDCALFAHWNNKINEGDDVYHLGDFAFCSNGKIKDYTNKLNGNIFLVRGNHDKFGLSDCKSRGFSWVKDYYELSINEKRFVLFHFPLREWHWQRKGVYHLYGHTHCHIEQDYGKSMDVGIDNPKSNLAPFHIDEVIDIIKNR